MQLTTSREETVEDLMDRLSSVSMEDLVADTLYYEAESEVLRELLVEYYRKSYGKNSDINALKQEVFKRIEARIDGSRLSNII